MSGAPLLQRMAGPARAVIAFELDGQPRTGLEGDTVLNAVLTLGALVRHSELAGAPRAGLCFMGACQDCWMWLADGQRVRACSEALQPGMQLLTRPPA
jgi:predicted molibdopterin-dependent oxidoreductase YjgC